MSKYTTEVRFICESYAGFDESQGFSQVDRIIRSALHKIFDSNYPIFDENYREILESKILKHYYTREIGAETVGLWKLWLNTRMNEIMPYYNRLYESELLKFNPFYDVDLKRKHNKKNDGTKDDTGNTKSTKNTASNIEETNTNTENSNSNNEHWKLYSDTPQGGISGVESSEYLTSATKDTDEVTTEATTEATKNSKFTEETAYNTDTTNNSVIQNTEDYLETVMGKQGTTSYSKLLSEYRDTFLNIDMMVIEDLSDLFMNIW